MNLLYTDPRIPEDQTGELFAEGTDNQEYTQPVYDQHNFSFNKPLYNIRMIPMV